MDFNYDYYGLLGLTINATPEEISKAYRGKARNYHPDSQPKDIAPEELVKRTELFKRCVEAYEILTDPAKRAMYNAGFTRATPRYTPKPKPKPQKPKPKVDKNKIYPHNKIDILDIVRKKANLLGGFQAEDNDHEWLDSFANQYESGGQPDLR